jgi:hypothetical protein
MHGTNRATLQGETMAHAAALVEALKRECNRVGVVTYSIDLIILLSPED